MQAVAIKIWDVLKETIHFIAKTSRGERSWFTV
jgi:hypothetical protein